jgi:hypothetical protein
MAEPKTKETAAGVEAFLATVADEGRRADCRALLELMRDVAGAEPRMWGTSIVGFGRYHYRYASGHEGDSCLIGFSPRKRDLTLFLMPGLDTHAPLLARLGRHKAGKGCLYVKRLADVDVAVLRELIAASVAHLRKLYPS